MTVLEAATPAGMSEPLRRSLRVALLQVRSHPQTETHERRCVVDQLGLDDEQLLPFNVVHRPDIAWRELAHADAVIIGGSGDHTVTRDYDFTPALVELVREAVAVGKPLFGICWGHHFIARALGGVVRTDPSREEVGTFAVTLTEAGRRDPLFGQLPPVFDANLVHHDTVITLPPGAVELATSAACGNQILRIADKPVYGTQFHGELGAEALRERLAMYSWEYVDDAAELDEISAALRETPAAATVLARFLALYT